jgi:hypothetical protein
MAEREIDLLGEAFGETEKELFEDALADGEDRDLEAMEDPTGFSREPGESNADEGEAEDEGDGSAEGDEPEAQAKPDTEQQQPGKANEPPQDAQDSRKRVPIGELRDVRKRAQTAEQERDALKAQLEAAQRAQDERFNALQQRLDALARQPAPQPAQPAQPAKKERPDLFADPEGFVNHLNEGFNEKLSARDAQLQRMAFDTSLRIAAVRYGDEFVEADKAIGQLNPNDPTARMVQQRIMNAPDPGEEAVKWHREQKMLREVGPDPAAYRARTEAQVRETLMKDPEFRKQLLADLRAEAQGRGRQPNTIIDPPQPQRPRVPPSLGATAGGRSAHVDPTAFDDSEAGVFEFATAS